MKRLMWAGLLAVPFLAIGPQRASAHLGAGCNGTCLNLQGCFRLKLCASGFLKAWHEPFGPCCTAPCGGPPAGGCATGACGAPGGYGYAMGNCPGQDCSGQVPGPWYVYWPYTNPYVMTAPQEYPGWVYDMHFQTPAPIFPFWSPVAYPGGGTAAGGAGLQPVSYYPSYWYGR